jgi:hypothetical protein
LLGLWLPDLPGLPELSGGLPGLQGRLHSLKKVRALAEARLSQ